MYSKEVSIFTAKICWFGNFIICWPLVVVIRRNFKFSFQLAPNHLTKIYYFGLLDVGVYIFLIFSSILFYYHPHIMENDLSLKYYFYYGTIIYPFMLLIDYIFISRLELLLYVFNTWAFYADHFKWMYIDSGLIKTRVQRDKTSKQFKILYNLQIVMTLVLIVTSGFYYGSIITIAKKYIFVVFGVFGSLFPEMFYPLTSLFVLIMNGYLATALVVRFTGVMYVGLGLMNYGSKIIQTIEKFSKNPRKQIPFMKTYRELQVNNKIFAEVCGAAFALFGFLGVSGQVACGFATLGVSNMETMPRLLMLYYFMIINIMCTIGVNCASDFKFKTERMIGVRPSLKGKSWKWKRAILKMSGPGGSMGYLLRFRRSCPPITMEFLNHITIDRDSVVQMDQLVVEKVAEYGLAFSSSR